MLHVLCFGNLWQGDDGFGIQVGRSLQGLAHPGAMQVFEIGLRGMDALPFFDGCDEVILVDAVHDASAATGTLRVLLPADIAPDTSQSGHSFGVNYLLQMVAATQTKPPPVTLMGAVVAAIVPFTDQLSAELEAARSVVVDCILQRLSRNDAPELPR